MNQPKELKLLSLAQMGKFFSHYGMRSILILHMIKSLQYGDTHAFGISAVFCSLVELGSLFGGIIADKYIGLRRAVFLGGGCLGIGYFLLTFEHMLTISLGLIIVGGSLFSSNLSAILGDCYEKNDSRREKGFIIFYMMQNLGALISTLFSGLIANQYAFEYGFLFASIGMIGANIALFSTNSLHKNNKKAPLKLTQGIGSTLLIFIFGLLAMSYSNLTLTILPIITVGVFVLLSLKLLNTPELPKTQVKKLLIYLCALILFFAILDQMCTSLIVFAERSQHSLIPSSMIMCLNPIVILLFGTVISGKNTTLLLPFSISALSFFGLAAYCLLGIEVPITGIMAVVILISIAELMIGPHIMSVASEVAAEGNSGMIMGMVPIGFSLAFLLGGGLSTLVSIDSESHALTTYGIGFAKIALLTFLGGLILNTLIKRTPHEKCTVS